MKYRYSSCPEEYLEYVLKNWTHFNESNGGICKAIRDLLDKVYELERREKKNRENS